MWQCYLDAENASTSLPAYHPSHLPNPHPLPFVNTEMFSNLNKKSIKQEIENTMDSSWLHYSVYLNTLK